MAEYIEREAAIKCCTFGRTSLGLISELRSIPAADVAPVRHGRWCMDGDSVYVCSVCGETWTLIEVTPLDNNMHYCPNCGAKMQGDANE